ncbi:hypothetical protein [Nonomuraea jabiensis]|uniref:hypothetical protein n=1 Tax=Nonomuraea jabiensis TaxID=882448 RepID=UPI003D72517E
MRTGARTPGSTPRPSKDAGPNAATVDNAILGSDTTDQTSPHYENKSSASLTVTPTGNLIRNVPKPLVKVPDDATPQVGAGL